MLELRLHPGGGTVGEQNKGRVPIDYRCPIGYISVIEMESAMTTYTIIEGESVERGMTARDVMNYILAADGYRWDVRDEPSRVEGSRIYQVYRSTHSINSTMGARELIAHGKPVVAGSARNTGYLGGNVALAERHKLRIRYIAPIAHRAVDFSWRDMCRCGETKWVKWRGRWYCIRCARFVRILNSER